MRSSQSRVAKIEAGAADVSIELLIHSAPPPSASRVSGRRAPSRWA
jgi:hypothetical protein